MPQNSSRVGPSSSTEKTAALIVNTAAVNSQMVNSVLDDLLGVLSSNETGHPEIDESLRDVRHGLNYIEATQTEEGESIRALLKSVLDGEALEHLQSEIGKRVDESVDKLVAQLVETHIGEYVPKSLRDSVDKQCEELDSVRIQLHNMRATKTPPFRRGDTLPESVNELLGANGKLSELTNLYGGGDPGS